jgi:hypothetical protein
MSSDDNWRKGAAELHKLARAIAKHLTPIQNEDPRYALIIIELILSEINSAVPSWKVNYFSSGSDDVGEKAYDATAVEDDTEMEADEYTTQLIEYLILRKLETDPDRIDKRDLFRILRATSVIPDNMNAFSARLSRLKAAGLIGWEKGKQNPLITISEEGRKESQRMGTVGSRVLSTAEHAWINCNFPWASLPQQRVRKDMKS